MKRILMHRTPAAALLIVGSVAIAGCSSTVKVHTTSAGPAWRVCGHTLYSAPMSPTVIDATGWPSKRVIDALSAGHRLYLRLSRGCSEGVRVHLRPRAAGTIAKHVVAGDGLAAAVIEPHRARFDIVIVRADGTTKVLHVRLG